MLLHLPKPIGLFETPAIWVDAPRTLPNKIYLPVDSVILSVFRKLSDPFVKKPLNWDFNNVNAFLMERCGYNSEDMLVWDDLWFWGYFNQHVDKPGRRHEWNPAKYWANREADKNKIESVEQLSKLYLNIVGSDN